MKQKQVYKQIKTIMDTYDFVKGNPLIHCELYLILYWDAYTYFYETR